MLPLFAKPAQEAIEKQISVEVSAFKSKFGRAPKLAVVLVGQDPASVIYTSKKGATAVRLGFEHISVELPVTTTKKSVFSKIQELNDDPSVDGILIQRPLPKEFSEEEVSYWVAPHKDVDAFHPENIGRLSLGLETFQPCTPAGVMEILKHYKIDVAGKLACIVGRSSIVGKPMAQLLLAADATVIQCHSKTKNRSELTRQADLLVVAAGKPEMITAQDIKPGAVVIDVGIHRRDNGKLCGDVRFEDASKVTSALTPVPGGVGPMTITLLMKNTLKAAQLNEMRKNSKK